MAALPPGCRLDADGEVVRRESRLEQWNREHYPDHAGKAKEVSMATKQTQAVMMAKVRATPIPCADCGREFTRTSPNQKRCPECQAKRVKAQAAQRRAAAATRPAKSGRLAWQEFLDAALSRVREGLYTSCTECYRALLGREWATPVPKLGAFAKYWQAHRMADLIPGAPEPATSMAAGIGQPEQQRRRP